MSYETETAGRYRIRATQLRSMPTTYEDRESPAPWHGLLKTMI